MRALGLLTCALVVSGCLGSPTIKSAAPTPRPAVLKPPPKAKPAQISVPGVSQSSTDLRAKYAAAERKLLNQGRLRLDTNPPDAPYTPDDLVRNFSRIAFFEEFTTAGELLVKNETSSPLRRFEGRVRVATLFGGATDPFLVKRDQREVEKFTRELANLSGLDMKMSLDGEANFFVLFLNRDEQRAAVSILKEKVPGVPPSVTRNFRNSPDNIYCTAYSFASRASPERYKSAIVLIKSEHPDLTRLSCIHEEMAQALGLSNDSKDARPSIFNDDEEFSLLTNHDAALLRMLYDRRLRPGMTLDQARALLPAVARDAFAPALN